MQLLCWDMVFLAGLGGFSFWVLSSVGKVFGMFLGWFLFLLHQARLGLDALPAHATRGKGGVTSDWLCLGREGALGPAINIVASLCANVRFFG
jgi:hypothetical protein